MAIHLKLFVILVLVQVIFLHNSTSTLVKVQSACIQSSFWSPSPSLVQNLCLQCFCTRSQLSLSICRVVPAQFQASCLIPAVTTAITTTTTTARPPNATLPVNMTTPAMTTVPTTTVTTTTTTIRPTFPFPFNTSLINSYYPFLLDLIQSGAGGVNPIGGGIGIAQPQSPVLFPFPGRTARRVANSSPIIFPIS